jgi:hypothetical protein
MADSSSTSADMQSWIWHVGKKTTKGSKDPLIALLRFAYIDTVDYLDNLGWTLDEISRDSLDEFIMTRRLSAWRKLLNELEIEIPALGHSLGSFIDPDHAAHDEARLMLDDLDLNRIPEFLNRVGTVHAALRSEMALLDSSRSIKEACAMARLTELAFVFIPLTFASSLFSMQVIELEAGVSLWAFVLAALGLGAFTYATRHLLQIDFFRILGRQAQESLLTAGRRSSTTQSASSTQILKYATLSLWRHSQPALDALVFTLVLALPVGLIASMWSRNTLYVGLHAAMTLLVLPPGIAVACFATSAFKELTRVKGDEDRPHGVEFSLFEKLALAVARIRDKFHPPLPPPPPPPAAAADRGVLEPSPLEAWAALCAPSPYSSSSSFCSSSWYGLVRWILKYQSSRPIAILQYLV